MDNDQLKTHEEKRNKILLELQRVYENDKSMSNETCEGRKTDFSVRESLMEFSENNKSCYRCRHLSNIPQNLLQTTYATFDGTDAYEEDLTFIQAIVWLKSAITSKKDISVEEFYSIFHKQWDNNRNDVIREKAECLQRTNSKRPKSNVITRTGEFYCKKSISNNVTGDFRPIEENSGRTCDSDTKTAESIDLLRNFTCNKKRKISTRKNEDNTKNGKNSVPALSPLSPERYSSIIVESKHSNTCVIPDSDEGNTTSPDMFDDSLPSQKSTKSLQFDKNSELSWNRHLIMNDLSDEDLSIPPQSLNVSFLSRNSFLGNSLKSQNSIDKPHSHISLTPNIYENCEEETLIMEKNIERGIQDHRLAELNTEITTAGYLMSSFDTDDIVDIPLSHKLNNISPCKKGDSSYQTYLEYSATDTIETVIHGKKNVEEYSHVSPLKLHTREMQIKTTAAIDRLETSLSEKHANEKQRRISFRWLNYVLDDLNADSVAYYSVKVLLSYFEHDSIAKIYMKRRCWENSLEQEAVNAVLNFCDIFEREKQTNACTQEIVQTVTRVIEKILGSAELNKTTLWTYQITIILQFCNSMEVCSEIIDQLLTKLKSYGNVITSVMGTRKSVHNVINQLHLLFYALSICFEMYRAVFISEANDLSYESRILVITDLWKRQTNFGDTIKEETIQMKKQRWSTILNDFTMIAAEHLIQFAEKSRKLTHLLTYK